MKIHHEYNNLSRTIQFFNENDRLIYSTVPISFYNSLKFIITLYEDSIEEDSLEEYKIYNIINYILENKIAKYIKMETTAYSIFKANKKAKPYYLQHNFHFELLDNNILLELI